MNSTRTTRLAVLLVAMALVAAGGMAGGVLSTPDANAPAAPAQQGTTTSVSFENQTSDGSTVVVESVTLAEGGFVTIHDDTLLDGDALGSVVGVSRYLEAGTHENVTVTLAPAYNGTELDGESVTLIAMPHLDTNDNQVYDFVMSEGAADGPYLQGGEAVVDDASVTLTDDELPATAAVTFENQTSDGTTVVVESVTLSEGGFVAIHDDTLLDGDALGSVVGASTYLEAGTHRDVEIALARPYDATELDGESVTLIAMPHLDTNGDRVYEFVMSEGEVDGPYTEEDQAVVDDATVTIEAPAAATETPTETETATETETETVTETENETATETETPTETETATETETPTETENETATPTETDTPTDS